jgi:hypothetical protein
MLLTAKNVVLPINLCYHNSELNNWGIKVSYKLADGSLSTDYKLGDEFHHRNTSAIFVFTEDDNTACPWFKELGWINEYARYWEDLTPVKKSKRMVLIKRLKKKTKQLEAIIKELES